MKTERKHTDRMMVSFTGFLELELYSGVPVMTSILIVVVVVVVMV